MKNSLLLLVLASAVLATAQPALTGSHHFGGSGNEKINTMQPLPDGGFILVGSSTSSDGQVAANHGGTDLLALRTDAEGQLLWLRTFGGSQDEEALDVLFTSDGNFAIAGSSRSPDGDLSGNFGLTDAWLLLLDGSGDLLWQKNIGGGSLDVAEALLEMPDGTFAVAGHSHSDDGNLPGNLGGSDAWVFGLSDCGDLMWSKNYGGTSEDLAFDLALTPDGKLVATGTSWSHNGDLPTSNSGVYDLWVFKINSNGGSPIWSKTFGQPLNDEGHHILADADGQLTILGFTDAWNGLGGNPQIGIWDAWLLQLNPAGNLLWNRHLGIPGGAIQGKHLSPAPAGGFLLAGADYEDGLFFVAETGADGQLIWQASYGGSDTDRSFAIAPVGEKRMAVAGWAKSSDGDMAGNFGEADAALLFLELTPQASLGPDLDACQSDLISLDASDPDCFECIYQWQNGSTSPVQNFTAQASSPAEWAVTITDGTGLTSTDQLSLTVHENPAVEIDGAGLSVCPGNELVISALTSDCPGCAFQWDNNFSQNQQTVAPQISTVFSVTVTNQWGCTAAASHLVTVLPGSLSAEIIPGNDCAEGNHSATVQASGGSGSYAFEWNTGSTSPSLSGLSAGTYSVTVNDGGCVQVASAVVGHPLPFEAGGPLLFGGSEEDQFFDLQALPDGGWAAAGSSRSHDFDLPGNHQEKDAWVARMDGDFNLIWSQNYGGSKSDEAHRILPQPDGGFLVAGLSNSEDCDLGTGLGSTDIWLFRLGPDGQMLWQKRFGSGLSDRFGDLLPSPDGGFLLIGSVKGYDFDGQGNHGNWDVLVAKLDASGEREWVRVFGGSQSDLGMGAAPTPDGGFLFTARSQSEDGDVSLNLGGDDVWMGKVSASGELLWDRTFGGSGNDRAYQIIPRPNDGFWLTATSNSDDGDMPGGPSFGHDFWVFHLSEQMDILKKWTLPNFYGYDFSLLPDGDKAYLLTNTSDQYLGQNSGGIDLRLIRLNAFLQSEWDSRFPLPSLQSGQALALRPDGGILLAGRSPSTEHQQAVNSGDSWEYDGLILPLSAPLPAPLDLGPDTLVCAGQRVWLDAQSGICPDCTYLWQDASPLPRREILPQASTNWAVTVTDPHGCTQSANREVEVIALSVNFEVEDPACGDPSGSLTAQPSGGSGSYSFEWGTGSSAPQISGLPKGGYQVTVSDGQCQTVGHASIGGPAVLGMEEVPQLAWGRSLGGTDEDLAHSVRPVSDGGFVVIGSSRSVEAGEMNTFPKATIFKLGPDGQMEWRRAINAIEHQSLSPSAYDLLETPEGHFVFIGERVGDLFFFELSASGEILKQHFLHPYGNHRTNIEGYVNGNYLTGIGEVSREGLLFRQGSFDPVNFSGGSLKSHFALFPGGEIMDMEEAPEGVWPMVNGDSYGGSDVIVRRWDIEFELLWSKRFGGSHDDHLVAVAAADDGGWLAVGSTRSCNSHDLGQTFGEYDVWLLRGDALGNILWSKTFGGSADDRGMALIPDARGGWLVAASTQSADGQVSQKNHGGEDIWVFKVNDEGDLLWDKTFGGNGTDIPTSLRQLPGGSLVLSAQTDSGDGDVDEALGGMDYWVAKLDFAPPTGFLGENQKICPGESLVFDATVPTCPDCEYLWNTGENSPEISISPSISSIYKVSISNGDGCSAVDEVLVEVAAPPDAALLVLPGTDICPQGEIFLEIENCPGCSGLWQDGKQGLSRIEEATATTDWEVLLTNPDGCSQMLSQNVNVHDLSVRIEYGDCSAEVVPTGGSGSYDITWDNGHSGWSIDGTGGGHYAVTVTDGSCEWTGEVALSPALSPVVEWEVDIFPERENTIADITALPDGYVVVGDFTGGGNRLRFMARLNAFGQKTWWRTFETEEANSISVMLLSDGNFIMTTGGYFSIERLTKIQATDGKVLWDMDFKRYEAHQVIERPNGELLAVGWADYQPSWMTANNGNLDHGDLFVMRISAEGIPLWGKLFGGGKQDEGYGIAPVNGGGYVLTGMSRSFNGDLSDNQGYQDLWVMKLDGNFNLQWSKNYGGSDRDEGCSVVQLNDGGYAVLGYTRSDDGQAGPSGAYHTGWLLRLNSSGNIVWKKRYPSALGHRHLRLDAEGNIVAAMGGLLKVKPDGELIWRLPDEQCSALGLNPDGSMVYNPTKAYGQGHFLRKINGFRPTAEPLGDDLEVCWKSSVQLPGPASLGGDGFVWENGNEELLIELYGLNSDTSFVVTVTGGGGCEIKDTLHISILPHEVFEIEAPDPICQNSEITLGILPDCPTCAYRWYSSTTGYVEEAELSLPVGNFSPYYYVYVTDSLDCTQYVTEQLTVTNFSLTIETDEHCGEGHVSLIAQPSPPSNYTYLWNTGDSTQAIENLPNGDYSVTVHNGVCPLSKNISVQADSLPALSWTALTAANDQSRIFLTADDGYEVATAGAGVLLRKYFGEAGNELGDQDLPLPDTFRLVEKYPDGHYLLGGQSTDGQESDLIFLKMTEGGTVVWEQGFPNPGHEILHKMTPTADGGAAFTGQVLTANGNYDLFAGRLSPQGELLYLTQAGDAYFDAGKAVLEDPDGGLWVFGETRPAGPTGACFWQSEELWLLKFNPAGNIVFSQTYGSPEREQAVNLHWAKDGNLLLLAMTDVVESSGTSGAYEDFGSFMMMKISKNDGLTIWETIRENAGLGNKPYGLTTDPDHGYWVWSDWKRCLNYACNLASKGALLHISEEGEITAEINTGYSMKSAIPTPDHGFAVNGLSTYYDAWSGSLSTYHALLKFNFKTAPRPELGNDTLLCAGEIILDAGLPDNLTYIWSTGETTPTITVGPGSFALTVTDGNGCSGEDETLIVPCEDFELPDQTGCGTVTLDAVVAGAVYLWDTGENTQTITLSETGEHWVSITLPSGDVLTDTVLGTVLMNGLSLSENLGGPSCFGFADGTISLVVDGANGLPEINWNTGEEGAEISGLPAGEYAVTVTDEAGCSRSSVFQLFAPPEIQLSGQVEDVRCHGEANGQLLVTAAGGFLFTGFAWSNGGTGPQLENLPPGEYSVTVTDETGCTQTDDYEISEPDSLTVQVFASPPDPINGLFDLLAEGTGGLPPFNFMWNTGDEGPSLPGLSDGEYTVSLTDANGCLAVANVQLSTVSSTEDRDDFGLLLFPNPASASLHFGLLKKGQAKGRVQVLNMAGQEVFRERSFVLPEGENMNLDVGALPSGMYFLQIKMEAQVVTRRFVKE